VQDFVVLHPYGQSASKASQRNSSVPFAMYGVLDGHNGSGAAQQMEACLHDEVIKRMPKGDLPALESPGEIGAVCNALWQA
jgi:hypothetical protein